jgi:hypothetical protein
MERTAEAIRVLVASIAYPTTKPDLMAAAIRQGLPVAVLERIEALPAGHIEDADQLGRALAKSRASSNPTLVSITLDVCDTCGFARSPGEPHSCVEEKARFTESANSVTEEFDALDDRR